MNFPGGVAEIPAEPTCNGTSGPNRVWPPEPPHSFAKLSDAALDRLAADLCTLLETELRQGEPSQLGEYVALLVAQTQEELLRRSANG